MNDTEFPTHGDNSGNQDKQAAAAESAPVLRNAFRIPQRQPDKADRRRADQRDDSRTQAVENAANRPDVADFKKSFAKRIPRKKDGVTNPSVAAKPPPTPAIFVPAKVAALIPIGPGVICEIVKISTNSLIVNQ